MDNTVRKDYMTPQELADILGTSAQMVRVCIRQAAPGWENIKYVSCGNRIKISRKSVQEIMDTGVNQE